MRPTKIEEQLSMSIFQAIKELDRESLELYAMGYSWIAHHMIDSLKLRALEIPHPLPRLTVEQTIEHDRVIIKVNKRAKELRTQWLEIN